MQVWARRYAGFYVCSPCHDRGLAVQLVDDPAGARACPDAMEPLDIGGWGSPLWVGSPSVATGQIGSGSPGNIRKWPGWLDEPYDEELVAKVERILAPVMDESWIYGLSENN